MTRPKSSNPWNFPHRKLPASGVRISAFGIRHFAFLLLLSASPLHAQTNAVKITTPAPTVDLARARAWLTARVPQMLADTTTPVRVLATTAQALTDTNLTAQLRTAILARQRPDGFFCEPGTPDALTEQLAAESIISALHPADALRSVRAVLSRRRADGSWSSTMGTSDRSDAVSSANTLVETIFTSAAAQKSDGGAKLADEAQANLASGTHFLESLQDEGTGLIGYETSSYGSWGATAAGYFALLLADNRSLATRRAHTALSSPDIHSYPARDAFREANALLLALRTIPPQASAIYRIALTEDLADHQAADGHWPAIKPATNDLLATASAIVLVKSLANSKTSPDRLCAPLRTSALPRKSAADDRSQTLLTLPAETADLLLIAPEQITQTNFVALCNQATLMTALQRRFTNPETKNLNTLGWKLADIAKAARAGPITFDRIANHIADEKNIPVRSLLGTDDLTAAFDTLTDKQLARALTELEKIPVRERLNDARNAWARNDRPALEQNIAALIPPTLAPVLEKLAALSATRIRNELQKNPDTLLILDAFLALGPHGILARLSTE